MLAFFTTMLKFNFSFPLFRCSLLCGVLCLVGMASAQEVSKPPVKVKAPAPELGQAILRFTPSPDNVALAPCPDPTPQPGLNQYVMTGAGGVFTIDTAVSYNGDDANFYYRMVHGLDWTIERSPSAMLPRVPNSSSTTGSSTEIFPQHTPPITPPSTVPGLAFEDVLPLRDNAASVFGLNKITHTLQGQTLATSSLALFYDSTARTHPEGGPMSCDPQNYPWAAHKFIPLPTDLAYSQNWFYYYSKAWQSPEPITYEPRGFANAGRSYYFPGEDHVHISNDAHSVYTTRLWETRPGFGPFVVLVGIQTTHGIDSFASLVTHECTHKTLYDSIQAGELDDRDGDGLPDAYELANDLDPDDPDSTDFGAAYSEYATNADQDVYCQMKQRDVIGPRELDWASDGLNWGGVPGQCPANRSPKSYYAAPVVPPN